MTRRCAATLGALLLVAAPAAAQSTPRLLGDLYPGTPDLTPDSNPRGFTEIGGRVVFHAESPLVGRELYVHDGAGTRLLRDMLPGSDSGLDQYAGLYRVGNALLFACRDSATTFGVYRTDGTLAGTQRVAALGNAMLEGDRAYSDGTRLWFRAFEQGFGHELYVSDGTPAGTYRVADINPGTDSSTPQGNLYGAMLHAHGQLFFQADDGTHGPELWVSDGTAAGTRMVRDGVPGTDGLRPEAIIELGSRVVFVGTTGSFRGEWWSSDGTAAGTYPFSGRPVMSTHAGSIARIGDKIIFHGFSNLTGTELYVTDGTAAGTVLLKDVVPGSRAGGAGPMTLWNGLLWFSASDGTTGGELWRSDGTPSGTMLAVEVCPGGTAGVNTSIAALPGGLVFGGRTAPRQGWEPWISDGTPAGTRQLREIVPGEPGSLSSLLTVAGGEAWFSAFTFENGTEPWKTDGTTAGTVQVAEVGRSTADSNPLAPAESAGLGLVFHATSPAQGREPWITDGTAAGTALWADLEPGTRWSAPPRSLILGDRTWWSVRERLLTSDLFGEDRQLLAFSNGFSATLAAIGNEVFFGRGTALWASDGTQGGTRQVFAPSTTFYATGPTDLTAANDHVFFFASHGFLSISGLFVNDGTVGGTRLAVSSPFGIGAPSSSQAILSLGDVAIARTAADVTGRLGDYWMSDGVTEVHLAQLENPTDQVDLARSPRVGEALFVASDGVHGEELWVTDGTAAGTRMLVDLYPGPLGSEPRELTLAGDLLFFAANDGVHGIELWVTDGTTAGTRMVDDRIAGTGSLRPQHMIPLGEATAVAFQGEDPSGRELWTSDGTAAGTERLTDLAPGIDSSDAAPLGVVGNTLVFAATTAAVGREPWAIDLADTAGFRARTLGAGCAGSTGQTPLAATGGSAPRIGSTSFELTLEAARPSAAAGLLLGFDASGRVDFGGCTLWLPGAPISLGAATTTTGTARMPLPIPADPALAGLELFGQWLVADPNGSLAGAFAASGLTQVVLTDR